MKHLIMLLIAVSPFYAFAKEKKPLSERVVTMNLDVSYDEEYNQALEEMQNLDPAAKAKLSLELEKILKSDKNAERRANAASALGDICAEAKGNAAILAYAADDKEKSVRQGATSALKRCGPSKDSIQTLKKLLKDKDPAVSEMAKMGLEEFGTPEAKTALSGK